MSFASEVMFRLRRQLDWLGPNNRPQSVITLDRSQAEFVYSVLLARAYRLREKEDDGTTDA